jgi:hypothetical protein
MDASTDFHVDFQLSTCLGLDPLLSSVSILETMFGSMLIQSPLAVVMYI